MTLKELEKLSVSKDYRDREKVAFEKNCPVEILTKLANDKKMQ